MNLTGVEIKGRYDGIAYRVDEEGNRYSKIAKKPIGQDELCKRGKIYKVDENMRIISDRCDSIGKRKNINV